MKPILLFAALCASSAQTPADAPAPSVAAQARSVYFLSMTSGFDQFLAQHVVKSGVFHVVTDPALADAVFTDRLGKPFEAKLDELYPPPEPPAGKDADDASRSEGINIKNAPDQRFSSFGRGKGNIFLVDRRTKAILWSTYERARSGSANDLNKAAQRVVERIQESITKVASPLSR